MPTIKGTWKEMEVELIQKRGEGLRQCPRGNYPCLLISPTFFNFIMCESSRLTKEREFIWAVTTVGDNQVFA
jgi:hypothetical protein